MSDTEPEDENEIAAMKDRAAPEALAPEEDPEEDRDAYEDDDEDMISDEDLIFQYKRDKSISKAELGDQYRNTEECQEFYAGDYMSYRDRLESQGGRGRKRRQVIVEFNKVKPYINSVKGFMAQNRKSARYFARVSNKAAAVAHSEHVDSYADFTRERGNFDQHETQMDGDMLINGYACMETAICYGEGYATSDPNGEICGGRIDPRLCWWDAAARATNVLDRRFCGYTQEYHLEIAKQLYSGSKEEDFDADGKLQGGREYFPGGGPYTAVIEDVEWANEDKKKVFVDFYQWMEVRDYYRCDNPLKDQINDPMLAQFTLLQLQGVAKISKEDSLFTMDPMMPILDCNKKQKAKLEELFPEIEFETFKRKVYFGAVLSKNHVFRKFRLLSQSGFTIQFKTGDRDEKKQIWVGMVNSMKDPIVYYNRALTELMYTIASSAKGGVMYEKSAIENIRKFEEGYGKTNGNVPVADGALSGNRIKPKREQNYSPTGLETLIQIADSGLAEVTGLDKSFLGSSENKLDTASLLRQRIKQVTSVLACYFDAITLYQKTHARVMLDLMRVMVKTNPYAFFRVTGEDGDQSLQQVQPDKFSAEYDIDIQEGTETADEKEERAKLVISMGKDLLAVQDPAGKMLYAIALDDLPINSAKKVLVMKALMPDAPDPHIVAKLRQQVKALAAPHMQAELMKTQSEADKNTAAAGKMRAETPHAQAKTVDTLESAAEKSAKTHLLHKATHAMAIV